MFHVKENTEASTTTATHDRNGPSCILVDRILSIVVVFSFVVVVVIFLLLLICFVFVILPHPVELIFFIQTLVGLCVIELLSCFHFLSHRFPYLTNSYFSNNWLRRWKRT